MKKLSIFCCTLLLSGTAFATDCNTVKEKIAEKIHANGVTEFTLEAVDKGTVTDRKIVGVCSGGAKDIVYQRGHATTTEATEKTTEKPAVDSSNTPTTDAPIPASINSEQQPATN